MKYLQSLRSSDKVSLKLTHIGVITPYRKQVCTANPLSLLLNSSHWSSIEKWWKKSAKIDARTNLRGKISCSCFFVCLSVRFFLFSFFSPPSPLPTFDNSQSIKNGPMLFINIPLCNRLRSLDLIRIACPWSLFLLSFSFIDTFWVIYAKINVFWKQRGATSKKGCHVTLLPPHNSHLSTGYFPLSPR